MNDPHTLYILGLRDEEFEAPSVKKVLEETMRSPLIKNFLSHSDAFLKKYPQKGVKLEDVHKKICDSFLEVSHTCDRRNKWCKNIEITKRDKDLKLMRLEISSDEMQKSFYGKALDLNTWATAGRKQAQKFEEELMKKIDSLNLSTNEYLRDIRTQMSAKKSEIVDIEKALKKALYYYDVLYKFMKIFAAGSMEDYFKNSGMFGATEMDQKTLIFFNYIQRTLDLKKTALETLVNRQDRLEAICTSLEKFTMNARKLILETNGFPGGRSYNEREYHVYARDDHPFKLEKEEEEEETKDF